MMLLGLDASTTRFGFAFGKPDDARPRSGIWHFPGADETVLDRTLGLAAARVSEFCRTIAATHVVIEAPAMMTDRSAHTLAALIMLTGAVRSAAWRANCVVRLVPSATARKHFIGRGMPRGKGDDLKLAVQQQCRELGWEVADDNAADACCVWSWGRAALFPRSTPLFREGARA